jgi:hypothetical protein
MTYDNEAIGRHGSQIGIPQSAPALTDTINSAASTLAQALDVADSILNRVRGSVPMPVEQGQKNGSGEMPSLTSLANLTQTQAANLVDRLNEILGRL